MNEILLQQNSLDSRIKLGRSKNFRVEVAPSEFNFDETRVAVDFQWLFVKAQKEVFFKHDKADEVVDKSFTIRFIPSDKSEHNWKVEIVFKWLWFNFDTYFYL